MLCKNVLFGESSVSMYIEVIYYHDLNQDSNEHKELSALSPQGINRANLYILILDLKQIR